MMGIGMAVVVRLAVGDGSRRRWWVARLPVQLRPGAAVEAHVSSMVIERWLVRRQRRMGRPW